MDAGLVLFTPEATSLDGARRRRRGHTLLQCLDDLPRGVVDPQDERHLPGQRVRGAAIARVVGAEGHLHHVEEAVVHLASVDETLGGLLDRHLDRSRVVHGGHHEVDRGQDAVGVALVVMNQRAARGLDDSDALGRRLGGQPSHFGARDLRGRG